MVLETSLTKKNSTKCMERKKSEHIYGQEQTREDWFSIHLYNLSLSILQNINALRYTVAEISLTKNRERKKKEQIQGRTKMRRLILNPAIQLVIANLFSKYEAYEVSILNGFRDIFDEQL